MFYDIFSSSPTPRYSGDLPQVAGVVPGKRGAGALLAGQELPKGHTCGVPVLRGAQGPVRPVPPPLGGAGHTRQGVSSTGIQYIHSQYPRDIPQVTGVVPCTGAPVPITRYN